jgi:hypothetical protein
MLGLAVAASGIFPRDQSDSKLAIRIYDLMDVGMEESRFRA